LLAHLVEVWEKEHQHGFLELVKEVLLVLQLRFERVEGSRMNPLRLDHSNSSLQCCHTALNDGCDLFFVNNSTLNMRSLAGQSCRSSEKASSKRQKRKDDKQMVHNSEITRDLPLKLA
jgi:hypothetical protein